MSAAPADARPHPAPIGPMFPMLVVVPGYAYLALPVIAIAIGLLAEPLADLDAAVVDLGNTLGGVDGDAPPADAATLEAALAARSCLACAFAPIAGEILYCAVDGPYPNDPTRTPYTNLTRPIWPIVDNPHEF